MKEVNHSLDISIAANKHNQEREFWKTKFNNLIQNYIIHPDKNIEDIGYKKESIEFKFDNNITQKLLHISNNSETRLLAMLMTGVTVFLSKYTDSNDVGFVVPIYKQKEKGDFINTILPILTELKEDSTFKDILLKIREEHQIAVENQNFPIKWLYNNLQGKNNINNFNFPFNVMVLLENLHDINYIKEPFDLNFSFNLNNNDIIGRIDYNKNHFSPELIEYFIVYLKNIFANSLFNLDIKLSEINILNKEDEILLKNSFNNFCPVELKYSSIGKWFEDIVNKYQNNTAIRFFDDNGIHEISYQQLNNKANVLANDLITRGIQKDNFIALLFKPSIEMIVSIIAVLKTGSAYIPISSDNPIERIKYILKNSSAKFLLYSQSQFENDVFEYVNKEIIINVDSIKSDKLNNNELVDIKSNNLAYMIYTSGSTGEPKGVLIEHKGIINYTQWRLNTYKYTEHDISLQLLSYEFDGFNSNFYTSILSGGTLILLSQKKVSDFTNISKIIKEEKVTNTSIIPRVFETIIDNTDENLDHLRFVVLAGEKCDKQIISKINLKLPEVKIINEYGPTESSVTIIANTDYSSSNYNIIGKPITNNNIYILNKNNSIVPVGAIGEICVSGVGLSRGYFNNDELSTKKFIANPFNNRETLYKTGDLGRWSWNGFIEYVGRKDRQVKIRGFRIELEEIESSLMKYAMVNDAIVDIKEINNNPCICAYIVTSDNKEIIKKDFDSYLKEHLPYYMLPQFYIQIDEIPITSSGKINRNALPNPKIEMEDEQFLKPEKEVEIKMAKIWSDVLNIDANLIGVNSNFFEIGGHSLNATILINKIHKEMNVKIPLIELFKTPTIRGLLEHFKNYEHEKFQRIPKVGIKDYYHVSLAQKRLFLTQQRDIESIAYNVPSQFIINGVVNIEKLEMSFSKLIERHECLRTSFHIKNDEIVQKIDNNIKVIIEKFKIVESEIDKLIKSFTKSFDLSKAPLIRFGLIYLTDVNKSLLMIDMHHIITDGVSVGLLMNDFIQIYNNRELPNLRIQYKDFAEWQKSDAYKMNYEKQEKYWDNIFSKKIERLKLPIDGLRNNRTNAEGFVKINIKEDLDNKIFKLASEMGVTVYVLVISIFNIYLSKLCKSNDIIIGSPTTGRTHSDMENIVGYFVNTMVLRNNISDKQSFKELIQVVSKNCYDSLENQDYSFENLVHKFDNSLGTGRNPIFDVFLNYNNFKFLQMKIDGIELEPYNGIKENQAKFDLSLNTTEYENNIYFSFSYNSNLFSDKTMNWQANCFSSLINSIVSNPELKIEDIDITGKILSERVMQSAENPFDL